MRTLSRLTRNRSRLTLITNGFRKQGIPYFSFFPSFAFFPLFSNSFFPLFFRYRNLPLSSTCSFCLYPVIFSSPNSYPPHCFNFPFSPSPRFFFFFPFDSTRLAESFMLAFTPLQKPGYTWQMNKLASSVSPLDVMQGIA